MNMAGTFGDSFAGARPIAQHCADLIRSKGPRPEERVADVSAWCRDLGQELAQELSQLFTSGKLTVTVAQPEMLSGQDVFERIGAIAANSLLRCNASGGTALLTLDFATAIALTDCSFGGDGKLTDDVPEQLPGSAALLVEQVAGMFAQAIAVSNGSAENSRGDVLVRSESVTRLKPFAPDVQVAFFSVSIRISSGQQWSAQLAICEAALGDFLPGSEKPAPAKRSGGLYDEVEAGAFAEMPMPVEAVLSEFDMSLAQLGRLAPGDEIPLAIAGELPLRLGADILAHGKLGTLENRMALRVTRLHGQARAHSTTSKNEAAA